MDDVLVQRFVATSKMALKEFGRRESPYEILTIAVLVADGYQHCQETGASFRAWVREHMSVSMPTAYKLVKIGQNSDRVLAMLRENTAAPPVERG
jgi:hypothetical protein